MRRLAATAVASTLVLTPVQAAAGDGKPLPRGTLTGSLGLGGSFGPGRDINILNFGGGVTYFPWSSRWNSIGFGLSVADTVLLYSDAIKNDPAFDGIQDNTPTNILQVTPHMIFTIVRTRWFTPYVWAGVGPTIYNNRQGVIGHWTAGPGAMIGVGGPVFIDVGARFSSTFPTDDCRDAFRVTPGGPVVIQPAPCGFTWWPQLGLTLAFGIGGGRSGNRKSRRQRRQEEREREEAPTWEEPPELEAPPPVEPAPEPTPAPQRDPLIDEGGAPAPEPGPDAPSETAEPPTGAQTPDPAAPDSDAPADPTADPPEADAPDDATAPPAGSPPPADAPDEPE